MAFIGPNIEPLEIVRTSPGEEEDEGEDKNGDDNVDDVVLEVLDELLLLLILLLLPTGRMFSLSV